MSYTTEHKKVPHPVLAILMTPQSCFQPSFLNTIEMADPVSIVTGIVTLLTTIRAAVEIINTFRDAPKHFLEINGELSTLKEILEHLKTNIDIYPLSIADSPRTQMLGIILECHSTTQNLHEVIQEYSKPLGRLKWPIKGKDKVAEMRQKLARTREMLCTMLGATGL